MNNKLVLARIKMSLFLLFLSFVGLSAQTLVSTTGNTATGNGGSISYTVGQMINTSNTGNNGSLLNGMQQPFEISILSGLKEKGIELMFNVYPNPTTENLVLNTPYLYNNENMLFQLYDLKGVILHSEKIQSSQTAISLNKYVPSTYFIKVLVTKDGIKDKELKVFKVIKK